MTDHAHITARLTHRYDATPGDVFDAWLDPESVQRWMGAALSESAPGTELLRVEIDARVGGTFRFIDSRDPEQAGPTGLYLEIDRPRRLAFTWLPEEGEHSVVTTDITADGDGALLTLTHEMEATWADYLNRTQETWARMADQVGRHLSA
ncbi:SRPBCC family protein [Aeromicrobium alkaliterrae]|uniref:Activator of Hsp90 ATPase homologue 1/2-like C-terminal domain-containing protein n=1 Tax=Aeromicrobium alkaliterrae TaxID=302168 RepID=A0ABN2K5I9_9ACTN